MFQEPEPIMVYEEEEDENLAAILDAEVGLRRRDSRRYAAVLAPSRPTLPCLHTSYLVFY